MAHLIECRKVNNIDLLLYFNFGIVNTSTAANAPASLTADKWISINNWLSIFRRLETLVISGSADQSNKVVSFELDDTPLSFVVSWASLSSDVGQLITTFLKTNENQLDNKTLSPTEFLTIRVTQNVTSKFTKHMERLQTKIQLLEGELRKIGSSSGSSSYRSTRLREKSNTNKMHTSRKMSSHIHEDEAKHEEYIPNAIATKVSSASASSSSIKYKPGKLPVNTNNSSVESRTVEPYVPPKISPIPATTVQYIPSYRPPKLNAGKTITEENRTENPSTRRKRRSTSAPSTIDSEVDSIPSTPLVRCSKRAHLSRMKTTSSRNGNSNRLAKHFEKSSRSKNNDEDSKENPSLKQEPPKKKTKEEYNKYKEQKCREIDELVKIRDIMKPKSLPDIEVLTLKHLSLESLEEHFSQHEPLLRTLFESYHQQNDCVVRKPEDMSMYAINYLMDNKQQLRMMDILTNAFGGEKQSAISNVDLFWQLLMPEWGLSIFMLTYDFTRSEATDRMRVQELITASNYPLDSDVLLH